MEILLIFWLLCGVVCYFIMKSKGYPNDNCLLHGVGGALLGVIWLIVVLCKKDYSGTSSTSQLSDMELLSKLMDLKERGAITEAEFEEKKRELLSNVKKNGNSVAQTRTLRMITVLLFLTTSIICGIGWLAYENESVSIGFSNRHISYGNFQNWIMLSYFAMAIICILTVILLISKVDARFLCIPIIAESTRWFFSLFYILKGILGFKNFNINTYLTAFCAIFTIIFIILILLPNNGKEKERPVILYILPGICRAIYAIYWFMISEYSPLNVPEWDSVSSWFDFLGKERAILSIAFILLGLLIHQLSTEKTVNNTAIQ